MSQAHRFPPGLDGAQRRSEQKETRLTTIRKEAELQLASREISNLSLPVASGEQGYYCLPFLKEPTWTWEVPLYFFVGGVAGTAGVISAIARFTGGPDELIEEASRLAMLGAVLSPPLLISDLGRPARFLAMLRVFKPQSPMSVGVWALLGFSGATFVANSGRWIRMHHRCRGLGRFLENIGHIASLAFGPVFASYTGVLIGATVVPAWNRNISLLPAHFAASGLGATVGILELRGQSQQGLQLLGIGAALTETAVGARVELRHDQATAPLRNGSSGLIIRIGGALSGPIPLALRLASLFVRPKPALRLRRYAAISAVVGSAITRAAWVHAGHISAKNSRPE